MASSPCPIFLGAACRCNCIPNFAVDPGSDTVLSIWVIREASEGWNKKMEQEGLEPTQTSGVGWKKETGKSSPINWWKLISAGNKQQTFLIPRQESGMQLDRKTPRTIREDPKRTFCTASCDIKKQYIL